MIHLENITGRRALRRFVQFAIDLYRGNDCYVPPIVSSEVDNLDPGVNPALEFCDAVYYLATDERGRTVGRIAGIVNRRFNEKFGCRQCRFCYVDFVDDVEVSRTLLDAVARWGRERGMTELVGPLGFTDLDYEGCLIDGYDRLSTSSTIYNYPYYRTHFERYGMAQDAVWNEYLMRLPDAVPEKHLRVAEMVARRYQLTVVKPTNRVRLVRRYGRKIFELLNEAYEPLYGFCSLTEAQIRYYIKLYLPFIRLDCVRLVVNTQDEVIAFGITCPSLSRAQQKAGGRLFPLGFWHLLRAVFMHGTDIWDLYLVGVRPDYQGRGVNALLFTDLIPQAIANGYKWVESNPELATNHKVQEQWQYFNPERHKQRCTFKVALTGAEGATARD
jgi:GNAT superfamily N-acetyltransferase